MPSRQTSIRSHLSSQPASQGESSYAAGARARRTREYGRSTRQASDSEGSEGIQAIRLSPEKPASSRRDDTAAFSSEDEAEVGTDDQFHGRSSPQKRKAAASRRFKQHYDPDSDLFSYKMKSGKDETDSEEERRKMKEKRKKQLWVNKEIEKERKKQEEEDDIGEQIIVSPSPSRSPSPPRVRGRKGKSPSIVIIDVDARPSTKNGRATRGRGRASSGSVEPAVAPLSKRNSRQQQPTESQKSSSSLKPPTRSSNRSPLSISHSSWPKRKSFVEVEVRRLSSAERAAYKIWRPRPPKALKPVEVIPPLANLSNDPIQPDESLKLTDDIQPTEAPPRIQPTQPTESTLPTEPIPPTVPIPPIQHTQPIEPSQPTEPTQPIESTQPLGDVQPIEAVQLTDDIQPIDNDFAVPARSGPPVDLAEPMPNADTTLSDGDFAVLTDRDEAPTIATTTQRSQQKETITRPDPVSVSSPVVLLTKRNNNKGKEKAVASSSSDEDTLPIIMKRPKVTFAGRKEKTFEKPVKKKQPVQVNAKLKKKKIRDSDDELGTEEESNILDELVMDEPERFKSATRLREKKKKETPQQRAMRKARNKRMGIVESSSESSSEEESDDESGSDFEDSSDSDDFIVDDGDRHVAVLPHQFSHNSAQSPEFKFKVVFHLLVLLVVKGPSIFPLRGENATYFRPQLLDLRRKMTDLKTSSVRSQVWRTNFVDALEKYPLFHVEELQGLEPGCDACHMSGRRRRYRVTLEGPPYDPDTHKELDSSDESDSTDSSGGSRPDKLPDALLMGRFCRARAEIFHKLSHWEDDLFHRIRGYYHDLLRAKYKPLASDSDASSSESDSDSDPEEVKERKKARERRRFATATRVDRLRKRTDLPEKYKDVDKVTEWMDVKMQYATKDFQRLDDLMKQSAELEHDKRKDD